MSKIKDSIIKNRIIKEEYFFWKRFKPWKSIRLVFKKLFDLFFDDFSKLIDIKSLEWDREGFVVLLIEKSSWEILDLRIKDNNWVKTCWAIFCSDNLCLWVHKKIWNETYLKFLKSFYNKWWNLTFKFLMKVLTKDFKAKKEFYQIFWKQNRPHFSIIQDWGHPLQSFRFIVPEWVMRNMDQSISLNLPEASVHHSERECKWISPNNKDTGYHFFNFPWSFYDHRFDKYYYLSDEEKQEYIYSEEDSNNVSVFTDLTENDIVLWYWTEKLNTALEKVVKDIDKKGIKMLSFNCCCVPRIIWDDIYSTLKRFDKKIDVPFLFQWQLEKTPYEQKILLLEQYIDKLDISKIKKITNSVSIFWYHENFFQKDLWDVLINNNIKINTSFIPSIDVRLLELMYMSELFIFSPNNYQREAFEYPFMDIWTKSVSPEYPYWIEKTDNWFKEIWEAIWVDIDLWNEIKDIKDKFTKKVKYVEQKGYTIWIFFIWKPELENFLNPDSMNNINVIETLNSMWFRVELYIYDNFTDYMNIGDQSYKLSDWNHDEIETIINQGFDNNEKIWINYFSSKQEYESILTDNKLDLIYSDLYFDSRISDIWLSQLSLKNFYVWYSWALKSINELIKMCEITFYKNYNKYFNN